MAARNSEKTMKIQVRSYADLRSYTARLPGGKLEIEVGSTISDVLDYLDVPDRVPRIILVNGRYAQPDQVLQPGDLLVFFPPLDGG